jgi:hypothetical protein
LYQTETQYPNLSQRPHVQSYREKVSSTYKLTKLLFFIQAATAATKLQLSASMEPSLSS